MQDSLLICLAFLGLIGLWLMSRVRSSHDENRLYSLIRDGDLPELRKFLRNAKFIDGTRERVYMTAIELAAESRQPEILEYLIGSNVIPLGLEDRIHNGALWLRDHFPILRLFLYSGSGMSYEQFMGLKRAFRPAESLSLEKKEQLRKSSCR